MLYNGLGIGEWWIAPRIRQMIANWTTKCNTGKAGFLSNYFHTELKNEWFSLLVPFLLVRFILLTVLNKTALRRAAYFAPVQGKEKIAYLIYQVSMAGILLYPLFLTVKIDLSWQLFWGYFVMYWVYAYVLLQWSVLLFPAIRIKQKWNLPFLLNPMYLAYFVCFIGMAFLTRSLVLFGIVLFFQISAHWIILSEERWCIETFGTAYQEYMKKVRRYI